MDRPTKDIRNVFNKLNCKTPVDVLDMLSMSLH